MFLHFTGLELEPVGTSCELAITRYALQMLPVFFAFVWGTGKRHLVKTLQLRPH
jgi:hypothetical protein